MQFDTKSPVPKLIFSPVSGIPEELVATITEQTKSSEAESAIKLTVFQQDESEAPAQPEVKAEKKEEAEAAPEPTLREKDSKPEPAPTTDARSVIDKWKKKK
jgi:hypothetical protein